MSSKPLKLHLTAQQIYDNQFEGNKSGYDCLQVDTLLDAVIKDYEAFDAYYTQTEEEIAKLEANNRVLADRVTALESDKIVLQKKLNEALEQIQAQSVDGSSNLKLLQEKNKLEEALVAHGIDPKTVI